jgi:hypothetical protein
MANIIQNSSFEITSGECWYYASNKKIKPLWKDIDTGSNGRSGTNCLKLYSGDEYRDPEHNQLVHSKIYTLKKNTQYTASLYAKNGSGYNEAKIGIGNAHSDSGFTDTYSSAIEVGVDWTRITVTFTTVNNDLYLGYYVIITPQSQGNPDRYFYVDDIQLEEGGSAGTWGPAANVEVGWTSAKDGNVFLDSEAITMTLNFWNKSGSVQSVTASYQVYDYWNNIIASGTVTKNNIADDSVVTEDITIWGAGNGVRGAHRCLAWVQSLGVQSEGIFSVLPVPRADPGYTPSAARNFGLHVPCQEYYLGLAKKMGVGWIRNLMPEAGGGAGSANGETNISRWHWVEASKDTPTYDTVKPAYVDGYGMMFLCVLGGEMRWIPTWASHKGIDITFNENTPSQDTIVIAGSDVTAKFPATDKILVVHQNVSEEHPSAEQSNEGIYTVDSIVYSGGNTTITLDAGDDVVQEASGNRYTIFNYTEWLEFVNNVVTQYDDLDIYNIIYWEVWNEPSTEGGLMDFSNDTSYGKANYTRLLEGVYAEIIGVDATAKVVAFCNALHDAPANDDMITDLGDTGDFDYLSFHGYLQGIVADLTDMATIQTTLANNSLEGWNTEWGNSIIPFYLTYPIEYYKGVGDRAGSDKVYYNRQNVEKMLNNYFTTILEGISGDSVSRVTKSFYYDARGTGDSSNLINRHM